MSLGQGRGRGPPQGSCPAPPRVQSYQEGRGCRPHTHTKCDISVPGPRDEVLFN